ncbi:hypothetical protein Fmac_011700 [Flemingia macrophylla]|uniref:Uncharacterized protein n=1 Tax=Flemingia macrophylla TaxID=520843 RepID=A0ABD1MN72_9FABA
MLNFPEMMFEIMLNDSKITRQKMYNSRKLAKLDKPLEEETSSISDLSRDDLIKLVAEKEEHVKSAHRYNARMLNFTEMMFEIMSNDSKITRQKMYNSRKLAKQDKHLEEESSSISDLSRDDLIKLVAEKEEHVKSAHRYNARMLNFTEMMSEIMSNDSKITRQKMYNSRKLAKKDKRLEEESSSISDLSRDDLIKLVAEKEEHVKSAHRYNARMLNFIEMMSEIMSNDSKITRQKMYNSRKLAKHDKPLEEESSSISDLSRDDLIKLVAEKEEHDKPLEEESSSISDLSRDDLIKLVAEKEEHDKPLEEESSSISDLSMYDLIKLVAEKEEHVKSAHRYSARMLNFTEMMSEIMSNDSKITRQKMYNSRKLAKRV